MLAAAQGFTDGLVVDAFVQQRDLRRLGVVAVQVDADDGLPRRRAAPHGPADGRPELRQAQHPAQRRLAQRAQFGGLRVGVEDGYVGAYFVFYGLVARCIAQAPAIAVLLERLAAGTGVVEALVDDQPRRHLGDFLLFSIQ